MLRLRPYQPSDAQYIVNWIKDEISFMKWSADRFGGYPMSAAELNAHYDAWSENFYKFTALDGSEVVGHFTVRFLDEEQRDLRLGFIIVDSEKRGKGYGKVMLRLALELAFTIIKAQRVSLGVFENNPAAHHCYSAAGLRDSGGSWECSILGETWKCIEMEITAQDYYGN